MWIRNAGLVSIILLQNASYRAIRMKSFDWFTYAHRHGFVGFPNLLSQSALSLPPSSGVRLLLVIQVMEKTNIMMS